MMSKVEMYPLWKTFFFILGVIEKHHNGEMSESMCNFMCVNFPVLSH